MCVCKLGARAFARAYVHVTFMHLYARVRVFTYIIVQHICSLIICRDVRTVRLKPCITTFMPTNIQNKRMCTGNM